MGLAQNRYRAVNDGGRRETKTKNNNINKIQTKTKNENKKKQHNKMGGVDRIEEQPEPSLPPPALPRTAYGVAVSAAGFVRPASGMTGRNRALAEATSMSCRGDTINFGKIPDHGESPSSSGRMISLPVP